MHTSKNARCSTWRKIFSCARAAFSAAFLSTTPVAGAPEGDGDGEGGGIDDAADMTLCDRPPSSTPLPVWMTRASGAGVGALLPLPRPAPSLEPGGGGGALPAITWPCC